MSTAACLQQMLLGIERCGCWDCSHATRMCILVLRPACSDSCFARVEDPGSMQQLTALALPQFFLDPHLA